MNCPYPDSNCRAEIAESAASCSDCGRFIKRCSRCAVSNRALANFCCACGSEIAATAGNWLGYKGGSQRLGLNAAPGPNRNGPLHSAATVLELQLGDPCRCLLGYDRHLIAVAQNGTVAIADPLRPAVVHRFQVHGPVTCDPCIDRGVLYVGTRGQLAAYPLGSTTFVAPHLRPAWTMPLSGTPIRALASAGGRLFITVVSGRDKEVQVIDNLQAQPPAAPRTLYTASSVSWVAADLESAQVVFFTEEDGGGTLLHTVERPGAPLTSHSIPLTRFTEHPIALHGASAFGIFGDEQRLYRIDVRNAMVDEALEADTHTFSISQSAQSEWSTEAVRIDSAGISFSRSGPRDSFSHHDRASRGSPLIVRGCAAVVGLQDGRILLYDLLNPPAHHVWRLKSHGDSAITALASFGAFIAAGNERGAVEVVTLQQGRTA